MNICLLHNDLQIVFRVNSKFRNPKIEFSLYCEPQQLQKSY